MMRAPPPTLEDILAASRVVAGLAGTPGEALALAWTIRNRARRAAMGERRFGDGSASAAARSLARDAPGDGAQRAKGRRLLRAAAIVCGVWADMAPDPTNGAVAAPMKGWREA